MLRKLRRLRQLTPGELVVFLQLVLFTLSARTALWFFTLPQISAFIAWATNQRLLRCLPLLQHGYKANRLAILAGLAARAFCPEGPCLLRSLLLLWLLKARGEPAQLLIGVRKDDNMLASHAWIEPHEKVVGENEPGAGFVSLARF
jgi:hypothetical protein